MHAMQLSNRPPAVGVGRRGTAGPITTPPVLSRRTRITRGSSSSGSRSVAARAGFLEAVLKPITTAGQVRVDSEENRFLLGRRRRASIGRARHRTRATARSLRSRLAPRRPNNHSTKRQIKDLKTGIAAFYDESSGLWEDVWGSEHMHHG